MRLGQWDSTASIFQEEHRLSAEMMADLTNTTASAFLGLTMSCCQCHDHKYDPLSQADHSRMRAFFAGVTSRDDLAISLADEQATIDKHNALLDQQPAPLKESARNNFCSVTAQAVRCRRNAARNRRACALPLHGIREVNACRTIPQPASWRAASN